MECFGEHKEFPRNQFLSVNGCQNLVQDEDLSIKYLNYLEGIQNMGGPPNFRKQMPH